MVLIHDRILKIDIYNFEMSQITPEKSLKSNQIYSEDLSCIVRKLETKILYYSLCQVKHNIM